MGKNVLIHPILKVCLEQSTVVIIGQNVLTLQIHEVYSQPSTVTIGRNDLIQQIHEVYSQPSTVIIMVDTKNDMIQSETFMEATNVLTNPMIQGVCLEQFMAIENKQKEFKLFEQMLDQKEDSTTFFGATRIR